MSTMCNNNKCKFQMIGMCLYSSTTKGITPNPTNDNDCKSYEPESIFMTDGMYEKLKYAVIYHGAYAIDDLLGYKHNPKEDYDTLEWRIDTVLKQMQEDVAKTYYDKYCKQ